MATMKKPAKKMQMGGMADSYTNYKMGGTVKAKNGKSFPDLNKDGKITKADILKGRGVIAKKGMKVKKAKEGDLQPLRKRKSGVSKEFALKAAQFEETKKQNDLKNARIEADRASRNKENSPSSYSGATNKVASVKKSMKKGGKMTKKCAYGCK